MTDRTSWLLVGAYSALARGSAELGITLIKAAGAFGFVTCLCGAGNKRSRLG